MKATVKTDKTPDNPPEAVSLMARLFQRDVQSKLAQEWSAFLYPSVLGGTRSLGLQTICFQSLPPTNLGRLMPPLVFIQMLIRCRSELGGDYSTQRAWFRVRQTSHLDPEPPQRRAGRTERTSVIRCRQSHLPRSEDIQSGRIRADSDDIRVVTHPLALHASAEI